MREIRVVIVDDSAIVRRLLGDVVEAQPDMTVVGTAANGRLAIERIRELDPDVVTLDIEMPEMNGLEALAAIRKEHARLPIIMFSTLSEEGGAATLEAFSLGASDFATKPSGVGGLAAAMSTIRLDLVPKIRALAVSAAPARRITRAAAPVPGTGRRATGGPVQCIAIGISTGGPRVLEQIIPALPADLRVPVFIVQHMPATFTRLLANRLDRGSGLTVTEGADGDLVEPGHVYVAPGGLHLALKRAGAQVRIALSDAPPEHSCRPAADVLFRAAVRVYRGGVLGAVLTGMGDDGAAGAREIRDAGGTVVAQDQASSVVWGMPGAVVRAGLADRVLAVEAVAPELVKLVAGTASASALSAPRVAR